jgi:hypothetical protein
MLMAEEQYVNAVELGEVLARVLLPSSRGEPRNTRVTQHDNQIDEGPKFAKLRAHGLDNVDRDQAPAHMGFVPLRDLRRRHADHAHFEPVGGFRFVDKRTFDHDRRRKPGRAIAFAHVAADDRKARLRISALEAVVEIVVSERRDRIVKRVHRGDDRVGGPGMGDNRFGRQIGQGRALKDVAVVE